jgi:hypothetical protein
LGVETPTKAFFAQEKLFGTVARLLVVADWLWGGFD